MDWPENIDRSDVDFASPTYAEVPDLAKSHTGSVEAAFFPVRNATATTYIAIMASYWGEWDEWDVNERVDASEDMIDQMAEYHCEQYPAESAQQMLQELLGELADDATGQREKVTAIVKSAGHCLDAMTLNEALRGAR